MQCPHCHEEFETSGDEYWVVLFDQDGHDVTDADLPTSHPTREAAVRDAYYMLDEFPSATQARIYHGFIQYTAKQKSQRIMTLYQARRHVKPASAVSN